MKIGNVETKNNIFLAPMAGVTDSAFRRICMGLGASLCYTEMVSAKAICYNDKKTHKLLEFAPEERPIFFQLFGSEPETIFKAIKNIQHYNPDGFDINMGCPTPKIVNNGDGSALMKNINLASQIVKAATEATTLPVSVKIRKGWDEKSQNAVEFAYRMQQSGASALCIHARTREQFYSPGVDLDIIKKIKQTLKIPVIGNGDIFSPGDAKAMLDYTGCDAVMIGRGSQGNPWIFSQVLSFINDGKIIESASICEKMDTAVLQAEMMIEQKGEYQAIREIRKHLIWYLKGQKGATAFKLMANKVQTMEHLKEFADTVKASII